MTDSNRTKIAQATTLMKAKLINSVTARLLLIWCISAIPAAIGLGVYTYHERDQAIEKSRHTAMLYVNQIARRENWLIKGYEQTLLAIEQAPVIANRDWASCKTYFPRLLKTQTRYVNVGVIDASGQVLCAGSRPDSYSGKSLADRPYLKHALSQPGFVLSGYLWGRFSHKPVMLIAKAIENNGHTPFAVLYAAISLEQLATPSLDSSLQDGAYITVVDRNSTVLFSTNASQTPGSKARLPDATHTTSDSGVHTFQQADGTQWFATTANAGLASAPYALSVHYVYPAAPITSRINRNFWLALAAIVGLLTIALALGWLAARAIIAKFKEHSDALQYNEKYDIATGLLNRASFLRQLNQTIDLAQQTDAVFYLAILNLSDLKDIGISLGYSLSEQILKETSTRISQTVYPDVTVCRLYGDEFALIIGPEATTTHLTQVRSLAKAMEPPFAAGGTPLQVNTYIGVARYPVDGASTGLLLQHANSAVLKAKEEGLGHAFYNAHNDSVAPARVLLATQLLRALNENEFELYYQPKTPLQGSGPLGFEALVRWNSPDQGVLSPAHYLSVIENGNLIHRFTLWVLDTAISQCKAWHNAGHHVTVAVNISTRNLFDLLLPERIQQILSKHSFPPRYLELEVTESSIMPNAGRSVLILQKIRNLGISVVIDDFGTGYSSLSYVQKLPIDSLKIDRSFVIALNHDDHAKPIIQSIIDMAHSMGIMVTAEGVETREVLDSLASMQCDHVQGYYVSKPMPASKASQWLQDNEPT